MYPSTTWVKLKRQITVAGHVLVKEYKDDGHTGTLLDRPALNQLRADLKTDLFDTVHFLAADRSARAVAYQTIIVDELLKHGKQIIINGKAWDRSLHWPKETTVTFESGPCRPLRVS